MAPLFKGRWGKATPRKGMALLMVLALSLLLMAFMAEYVFSTGLELRAMQTYKETHQARNLGDSAFRALQIGLMADEVEFMKGMGALVGGFEGAAVPFGDGFLSGLTITPLDPLFNLNRLYSTRGGSPANSVQWNLFYNTLKQVQIPPDELHSEAVPPDDTTAAWLFAALADFIDPDDLDYQGAGGGMGAEAQAYSGQQPQFPLPNGRLDKLTEIRLARGVMESRIPWKEWENRFTLMERADAAANLYPGVICANTASREEISDFLKARRMSDSMLVRLDGISQDIQKELNLYADKADAVADLLAPKDGERTVYNDAALAAALGGLGFKTNLVKQVFSTANNFYRVRLTAEIGEVKVTFSADIHVTRNAERIGTALEVLDYNAE
ncbi:MAG: general secretion pathway protein GspK [Deltaproteobacteria bacterium]|nr:general secretion pathway protein GspK [Deltaproteobacteria bacterium]